MRQLFPALIFAMLAVGVVGLPQSSSIPGHPMSDLYDHGWGYSWFVRHLLAGELPLWTRESHGPQGGALWFVDPLGALLSLPLQLLFPLPVALGILPILQLWLGMQAAYALGLSECRERAAAMVVALVFTLSSYSLSLLHSGTWEYLNLWPLPLFFLSLRRGWVGVAVLAWTAGCLGAIYYGAFLGLLALISGLSGMVPWSVLLRVGLYALLPVGAVLGLAGWTLGHPQAVIQPEGAPGWSYQSLPATDLLSFFHPRYWFPDNAKMGNPGIVHANTLGILNLCGLLWAWRFLDGKIRRALWITGFLCLGPTFCTLGYIPQIAGYTVPLPAALLYFPGSPFRMVHHPYRLVVLGMLFLGLALGHSVRGRPRLALGLGLGLLLELALFCPVTWPLVRAPAQLPAVYQGMEGGIFDFPPENHQNNRSYTWYAALHQQPIPYGVNVYIPEKIGKNARFLQWMGCLRDGGKRGVPREGGPPAWRPGPPPVFSEALLKQADEELRNWDYRWLVVHQQWMDPDERRCLENLLGTALRKDDDQTVWALTSADRG